MNCAALIQQAVKIADDVFESLFVWRGIEADQIGTGFEEHVLREFDSSVNGSFIVGDACKNGGVHGLAFEQHAVELLLLRIGGSFEKIQDG